MKQNSLRFIGITGGVGAGKSEILSFIRKHYLCEIYLADEVAHEVKKPGTECFQRLVRLLGEEILGLSGEIDKKKMADRIFRDQTLLEQVNQIIHPAVKQYLLQHLATARERGDCELFFVEAALLIEGGYRELVDELWYIYASVEVRTRRLASARGYGEEKIKAIMANQLSEEAFRRHCDFVIDNSGDLEDSRRQIRKRLEKYTWLE